MRKLKEWVGNLMVILVGLSWGDEGKGVAIVRLIKLLGLDFVVRWQGGPNAGHTVYYRIKEAAKKIVLKQLPSAAIVPGVKCFLAAGMVIDPLGLVKEMSELQEVGIATDPDRIRIDGRAAVIWQLSKRLEEKSESAAGSDCVGSIKRGMGPAYASAANRFDLITIYDLLDEQRLAARIKQVMVVVRRFYRVRVLKSEMAVWQQELLEAGRVLAPYVGDVAAEIQELIDQGKIGAAEGAQGTLLDIRWGTVPKVTSSHTIASSAPAGTGLPHVFFGRVIGVIKAYVTRVGNGPFPTKDTGSFGRHLQTEGAEKGSVTGRDRDCGAFDAVAARYAVWKNGVGAVFLTKLDVLSGLEEIPIGVAYWINGAWTTEFPNDPLILEQLSRVKYETMPGWSENLSECKSFEDLPINAQRYVQRLEELIGVPIVWIGVGGEDDQFITRENLPNGD